MKQFIQNLIGSLATKIVAKHQPTVIAITGSVGKTSTRNAICAVLSERFDVRTGKQNYNNEFGVPLTIIGMDSPGRSVIGWLKVLVKGFGLAYGAGKEYPKVLVLEFGADKTGDISNLCNIARPDVAILTAISPVHLEGFGSIEKLMDEKAKILELGSASGLAIVNEDDPRVKELAERAVAKQVSYGFAGSADIRVENYQLETREDFSFELGELFSEIHFDVVGHDTASVVLRDLLGTSIVSSCLAAVAVGQYMKMNFSEIAERLKTLKSAPGRLNPIAGIKGSLLIDDSYNAAPASMKAAVDTLAKFVPTENARRIAALGSMAELGDLTETSHTELGRQVALANVDMLVTVGNAAGEIHRAAIEAGLPKEHASHFSNSLEAGRWLDQQVQKGDIILIKGSQSTRMERVTKDLMANPLHAKDLLVRQYGKWLNEEDDNLL